MVLCLILIAACAFPGSVQPSVKIGLVAPFNGRYREVGYDAIHAVRLALSEANRTGAVAGYGLELVAYDDGGEPEQAARQARRLAVDPQVVGAIGHFNTRTTEEALEIYVEAGIPLLAATGLRSELGTRTSLYAFAPPLERLASALLQRASERAGDDEIVLVTDGGALGEALQDVARQRSMELNAVSADRALIWAGTGGRGTPAVLCDLAPVQAGELAVGLLRRGWEGEILGGPALGAPDFVAVAGTAAANTVFVTPWLHPQDVLGGERFETAYREQSGGVAPGHMALPAYEATWMLVEAIDRAGRDGELTRAKVSAALEGVRRHGLLGYLVVDDDGTAAGPPLFWYWIGEDGVPRMSHRDRLDTIVVQDHYPRRAP